MATAHSINANVTGFLAIAALERYQASWDELVDRWYDRALCRVIDAELAEIRKLMLSLPQLSMDMAEVVMRHAQLLRALVRPVSSEHRRAQVAALKRKHADAVAAIRRKCSDLFVRA